MCQILLFIKTLHALSDNSNTLFSIQLTRQNLSSLFRIRCTHWSLLQYSMVFFPFDTTLWSTTWLTISNKPTNLTLDQQATQIIVSTRTINRNNLQTTKTIGIITNIHVKPFEIQSFFFQQRLCISIMIELK